MRADSMDSGSTFLDVQRVFNKLRLVRTDAYAQCARFDLATHGDL
jgi:hypothetical protein